MGMELLAGADQTGTTGRDILDSTNGQPDQFFGQGGHDRLLAGKRDQLYGGHGHDRLDARNGNGRNQLFGGKGRDRLFAKRKDKLFGNQDNDFLSSLDGRGQNILKGNQGNDDLVAGKRDRLLGGTGADILDASANRGNNILFAGNGDDQLYAGVNDRLSGGAGDDILWAGLGGNRLTGDAGRDQFWITGRTLSNGANVITDFEVGMDQLAIALLGPNATAINLDLEQQGSDTVLFIDGQAIAILNNVVTTDLSPENLIFALPLSNNGTPTGTTSVTVELVSRAAKFANEMGAFFTDDAHGRIGDLLPNNPGYAQAALERSQIIFTAEQSTGATTTIDIPPQAHLAWYLVQNSTTAQFQNRNLDNRLQHEPLIFFSFDGANPDGDTHFRYRSNTEFSWEDLTNGGDRSFDDLVFKIVSTDHERVDETPVPPPNLNPEVPNGAIDDVDPVDNVDPVIVSEPVTTLSTSSQLTALTPVNLAQWEVVQYAGPGRDANWQIQADSTSVLQSLNANPSILLSNFELTSDRIEGTFQVGSTNDDDFIGFVFGYQNSEQFYLFDWKQESQPRLEGFVREGMNIKVVNANSPLTIYDLGPTFGDGDRVRSLFHNSTGWADNTEYQFTLDFTPGEFTLLVKEGESILLDETIQDDTYTSGQFGFYNYSQRAVLYEGFTQQRISSGEYVYNVNAIDANQDTLTYSLIEAPEGMTIDPINGTITWIAEANMADTQVAVTVLVEDARGGSTSQRFVINVI